MAVKVLKSTTLIDAASQPVFNFSLRNKYIFLAILSFVFYANSILNKYALDDDLAINSNAFVKMGIKGIPKILTHDSWASSYNSGGVDPSKLSLGERRFRPLSEITFAIEQQLFGNWTLLPFFRHMVNVLFYVACVIVVFNFLEEFLFKEIPMGKDIAFLSAFLFTIHPIHTEAVANIKSLDEILSLLFIMLTFIFSLKYVESGKIKHLIIGTSSFLLALLSKEYAVTLLILIPFLFYLLKRKKPSLAIMASFPYYGIFLGYLLLRFNAVGFHGGNDSTTLLSNPYIYATGLQKIATKWFVLGKYVWLLFFPYPLACDYSYNQIVYHSLSDISVLFSIVIYAGVVIYGIKLVLEKSILSFAVFFFILNIFIVSNFLLNIGTTMSERFVFQSSLGFVIVLSWFLLNAISKMKIRVRKRIMAILMSLTGVVCFGETVARNAQWKDDTSLFIHDVEVVPNSFLVNNNAGSEYLALAQSDRNTAIPKSACLDSAHKYLVKAVHLNPNYTKAYFNLGGVYLQEDLPDSTQYCLDRVALLHADNPALKSHYAVLAQFYLAKGSELGRNGSLPESAGYIRKAVQVDTTDANMWFNLGVAYYRMQLYDSAKYAWINTMQYKPNLTDSVNAEKGLQALSKMLKQ